MEMTEDWIYSPERMDLREQCLFILMTKFGSKLNENGLPLHSSETIYACAHDWVSHGNPRPDGIIKYYEAYYQQN